MRTHNAMYIEDVQKTADLNLQWEKLNDASVLITGASGLIGTFLVDVLMHRNKNYSQHCRISAMGRNEEKARKRFSEYFDLHDEFEFIAHDVNLPLKNFTRNYDFILHMASNTHPLDYSRDPVGTINANIIGLNNLLSFSREHLTQRFMFASTVEVYGNNRGDTEFFDENYCGYIDISKARSGYPESKRCGETLCQSYIQQYGLDIVIPRFSRTYGPTMQENDSKAIAQFIRKSIAHEDIVLKSEGTQLYSYTYAPDAVSALLTVMTRGTNGDAYNIADEGSDITLRELAQTAASHAGRRVVFELPDENERRGYSLAMKARLNASKLKALGWNALYDIKTGITRTIDILAQEMAS